MAGNLRQFRLITFDVTNTLLQFRTSPGKQYGEIGALFGVRCDNSDLAKSFRTNWKKMNMTYPNFGRNSRMDWQHWWSLLIDNTFKESGGRIPEEKLNNFVNHLLDIYKTSICWQHCNGSVDFLNYLRNQQINETDTEQPAADGNDDEKRPFQLGIIANFDPRLDTLLRNMKMNHYFEFILNSYDCKAEKPNGEFFEMAMDAAKLENLKPDECLHVGDGPTTDYLGAKHVGWHAALIHERQPNYLIEKYGNKINPEYVFPSLYDFHKKVSNNIVQWQSD